MLLKYRMCYVNRRLTVLHEWPVSSFVNIGTKSGTLFLTYGEHKWKPDRKMLLRKWTRLVSTSILLQELYFFFQIGCFIVCNLTLLHSLDTVNFLVFHDRRIESTVYMTSSSCIAQNDSWFLVLKSSTSTNKEYVTVLPVTRSSLLKWFLFKRGVFFALVNSSSVSLLSIQLIYWRFLDQSWFKSVVQNSQYFRKFYWFFVKYPFLYAGKRTTEIFKVLYL